MTRSQISSKDLNPGAGVPNLTILLGQEICSGKKLPACSSQWWKHLACKGQGHEQDSVPWLLGLDWTLEVSVVKEEKHRCIKLAMYQLDLVYMCLAKAFPDKTISVCHPCKSLMQRPPQTHFTPGGNTLQFTWQYNYLSVLAQDVTVDSLFTHCLLRNRKGDWSVDYKEGSGGGLVFKSQSCLLNSQFQLSHVINSLRLSFLGFFVLLLQEVGICSEILKFPCLGPDWTLNQSLNLTISKHAVLASA